MVRDDICYSTRCVTLQPLQFIAASEDICFDKTARMSVCTPATLCFFIGIAREQRWTLNSDVTFTVLGLESRQAHTHNVQQNIIEKTYCYNCSFHKLSVKSM